MLGSGREGRKVKKIPSIKHRAKERGRTKQVREGELWKSIKKRGKSEKDSGGRGRHVVEGRVGKPTVFPGKLSSPAYTRID